MDQANAGRRSTSSAHAPLGALPDTRDGQDPRDDAERIVVGIDGSLTSRAALSWGAQEAIRRDCLLDVVYSWRYPSSSYAIDVREEDLVAAAQRVLDETLKQGLGDLKVRHVARLVRGTAARALLEAAQGAALLVVGARGRGGFAGLLLGSVSQQCVHYANCPVVVVPAPAHPRS